MNNISITTQEKNDYIPNQYNNDTRFEGRTKELFTYFTSYARILNGQGWTKEYLMKELDAQLDEYSEIDEDKIEIDIDIDFQSSRKTTDL